EDFAYPLGSALLLPALWLLLTSRRADRRGRRPGRRPHPDDR
ncbi:C50 carotenoid gamma-cyclase subunit beta CrtYh, partial [Xanthomonas citri pv. citri]|nr:C50 carotenoid gamma-cyclase subunit beta CrtYh [Xanthomonas citri pv. citri]